MSYRLAVLTTHPIQYQAPFHAHLAGEPELALKVFFCHDYGVRPQKSLWGHEDFAWKAPLLEGYEYEFLPNWSWRPGTNRLIGSINPAVMRRIAREDFDAWLVYGWDGPTKLMTISAATLLRRPLLFRVDTNLLTPASPARHLLRRVIRPRLLSCFDAFLAVGRANAAFYRHYGTPDDRIFHVPFSVDNEYWRAEAEKQAGKVADARSRLGIAAEALVFLFCAPFVPVKDVFVLIEAFRAVTAAYENTHLVLVGSGPLLDEAKARARGIPRTSFLGFLNQDELPEAYALSDILVLPSYSEAWGLVVNEAMNFGNAVIVSDRCGCAPDLVEGRGTGDVFPSGDARALEAAMTRLVTDPEGLRSAQSRAKQVVKEYSYARGAEGTLAALRKLTR
jgi:glycosyltransferase involved in cell wall biosynthesis